MEKGRRLASFNAHRVILDLQLTADAGRIVLKLDRCARMPILCLHNSPAGLNIAQNRRSSRTLSISSAGSESISLGYRVANRQFFDKKSNKPSFGTQQLQSGFQVAYQ